MKLNPALRDFWRTKSRYKILLGGRASSKSYDAATMSVILSNEYKVNFLCARQFQNRIEDSVYTLLKARIKALNFESNFIILKNKIINKNTGSEFKFYGLWRNIDEIKSLEGIDVLWLEEAHNVTREQMEILEPTIRKENSEIWIIFNPRLASDYVYKEFVINKREDSIVRKINYDENPFLSKTILKTINDLKASDPESYNHIYLGEPLANDEQSIIKRKWITAAIDAHKKITIKGLNKIGFDVADDGNDQNAYCYSKDGLIIELESWKGGEDGILQSASKVFSLAQEKQCSISYDPIGVGASCGAKFKELNIHSSFKVPFSKFIAGDAVFDPDIVFENDMTNKEMFLNLKAQSWWGVAQKFKNTYNYIEHGIISDNCISLSSDLKELDKLVDELSTPRKKFAENGRLKVESKDELRKRGILSPNLADALIMSQYIGEDKRTIFDVL